MSETLEQAITRELETRGMKVTRYRYENEVDGNARTFTIDVVDAPMPAIPKDSWTCGCGSC